MASMDRLKNFADVHQALASYVPKSRSMSAPYTLERMWKLMAVLDNPQDKLKVIHVAGTSGKSSTSYYIAALLTAAGKKTGLSISPHIDEVNERLQINLMPFPEAQYCKVLSELIAIIESSDIKPTYFELLVAFAYWYFAKEKVDYAVMEVGMGGLLDGTNVVRRSDKVCIITDIGLDHTDVLGKTLPEIATQKAGIIQTSNLVFMYQQGDAIMQVVREVCAKKHAILQEIESALESHIITKGLPLYQRRNWQLAREVYKAVAKRDDLTQLSSEKLHETAKTYIPARMEIIQREGKTIILDGAHNGQKLEALGESLQHMFGDQEIAVLFSLVQSSNLRLKTSLKALTSFSDHLIVTSFTSQQDFTRQSINPYKIVEGCKSLGFESIEIVNKPAEAYQTLLKRSEPILVVTGSFYLMNHIRPIILKSKK